MMWIVWVSFAIFTDGLLDPKDEQSFSKGLCRLFFWPYELGIFISEKINDNR